MQRTMLCILALGLFLVCGCAKSAKEAFERGVSASQAGDHDKAIAHFTETIRLDPTDAKAYCNRGNAYEKKGEKARAEADFARAKKLGYKPP